MLHKLITKKTLTVLGLNSGTSIDSLDLAVVKIGYNRGKIKANYITGQRAAIPIPLQIKLKKAADLENISFKELLQLDYELGQFLGKAAAKFVKYLKGKKISIDLIASHGQTIAHFPGSLKIGNRISNGTFQLGSADMIASAAKKVVVHDFRQADIAVGGEGAPITGGAMAVLLDKQRPAVVVNIGGMSNFFYLPSLKSNQPLLAADCGPGNILSDLVCQKLLNIPFDKDGKLASQGEVSVELLNQLFKHRFFKTKTISTGREDFGRVMLDEIIKFKREKKLTPNDLLATVVELTVCSIQASITALLKKNPNLSKLYLTGGGRKNKLMVRRLKQVNRHLDVEMIDRCELDGDFVEAAAFAVMGAAAIKSFALEQCFATKKKVLPGKITQPTLN